MQNSIVNAVKGGWLQAAAGAAILSLALASFIGASFFINPHVAKAAGSTIFFDGFESDDFSAWDYMSANWSVISDAHNGSKAAEAADTGNDYLRKNVSTAGYDSIILSYWYKIPGGLSSTDELRVQWFDGTNWNTLVNYDDSPTVANWTYAEHVLPANAANNPDFKIRFNAQDLETSDKFRLDDVTVSGSAQLSYIDQAVVVHQNDLIEAADVLSMYAQPKSWFFYNDESDTIDNTLGSFVTGPDTAPIGIGSAEVSVTGSQRRNLATYQFSGTPLAAITALKFSTYNPSAGNGGSATRSAYINFNVDFTGSDAWQKRLAYVPSVNGTVSQDSWQEWDAIDNGDGLWCWSGMTGCGGSGSSWPTQTGTPFANPNASYQKWSDIVAAYPNIRVRVTDSWFGFRVGEPYADGYTEDLDKFIIGIQSDNTVTTTTYDFDPAPVDNTPPEIIVKGDYVGDLGSKTFDEVSFILHDDVAVNSYDLNGHMVYVTPDPWSNANFPNIQGFFVNGSNTITVYDTSGNSTSYTFTYPIPDTQCVVTVVSDETNTVTEKSGAFAQALTFIHTAWTAAIDGATWIWGDNPVVAPTTEETQTFVKTFDWSGPIDGAVLNIAADNYYTVKLNGVEVASEQVNQDNFRSTTQDGPIDVSANVTQGTNTLEIAVTNKAVSGSSPTSNPAGLKYSLVITSTETGVGCMSAPQPPTLCPLVPEDGDILIDFGTNQVLRADQDEAVATLGPVAVDPAIPAGYYDVTLASYDDHTGHGGQGQLLEQWYAIFSDSEGTVATTNAISDIPENVDWNTEQVNSALHFATDVTSVTAKHDAYSDNNPQSVYPSCIVLKPVEAPVQCEADVELLKNGGFENPVVQNVKKWDVFPSGTTGLEWVVDWFGGAATYQTHPRPAVANLELHRGVNGWTPSEGSQYAELDTDWLTPGDNTFNGEPASVAISQTVLTAVGEHYTFSFDFSPRPNTAAGENQVEVLVNGVSQGVVGPTAGGSNTSWTTHTFDFVADSVMTTVTIRDLGTPNAQGSFVDNASLMCVPQEHKVPLQLESWNDFNGNGTRESGEDGIPNWDIVVKPQTLAPLETLSVDSSDVDGATTTTPLMSGHVYLVEVEGTYQYSSNPNYVADAEYYNKNNWADASDWGSDNPTEDQRTLDVVMNDENVNWGSYEGTGHLYKTVIEGADALVNLRVFERQASHYADNSGTLTVRIYDVTGDVVTTGTDGTVMPEVLPGEYQIVEIVPAGWTQTAPVNPSYCHINTSGSTECSFGNYNPDVQPLESVITLPEHDYDSYMQGPVPLAAFYADENGDGDDGVQWAVRYNTCSASSGTVFGNVDGHNDSFAWDGTDFTSTFDASAAAPGDYCFVFNPTEDAGDANQRLTRWFTVTAAPVEAPQLTIVKNTNGLDGDFTFNVSTPGDVFTGSVSTTTVNGVATSTLTLGVDATYTVTEDANSSWTLTDAMCTYANGDPITGSAVTGGYQFNAVQGDDIICHFYGEPDCGEDEHYDSESKQCESNNGTAYFDLSLTKDVETEDASPNLGEPVIYTITVTNADTSAAAATGITIEDVLPAGVAYDSHSASNGDDSFDSNTGVWTVLSLAPGNFATLEIVAYIETAGTIENTATITGYTGVDTDDSNDTATASFDAATQCSDGVDNDGDQFTDSEDPDCHTDLDADNADSYDPTDNDESSPSDNGGGGSTPTITTFGGGPIGGGAGGGLVLGAFTQAPQVLGESCGLYMDQHLRRGFAGNNAEQVVRLQDFLNRHGFGTLSLTGNFGEATENAVKAFQLAYADQILTPWGITAPTGLVYLTTLREINLIECPDLSIQIPYLVDWSGSYGTTGGSSSNTAGSSTSGSTAGGSTGESMTNGDGSDEGGSSMTSEEGGSDNGDQGASAGSAVKNQGFWSRVWGIIFGKK